MALLALSINIGAKRYPRLWSADRLPSDAMQLMPVRSGGTLVLCQHLVLFYTQVHTPSLCQPVSGSAGTRRVLCAHAVPERSTSLDQSKGRSTIS